MKHVNKSSFGRGFAAGFASPYTLAYGQRTPITRKPKNLVSEAWGRVGKSIRSGMFTERDTVGKATKPTTKTDQ